MGDRYFTHGGTDTLRMGDRYFTPRGQMLYKNDPPAQYLCGVKISVLLVLLVLLASPPPF